MKYGIYILTILFLSCGDDGRVRNRYTIQQEQIADFSTQVDSTLKVSGVICTGEESVIVDGVQFICQDNDFLMRINDGLPFIALLRPELDTNFYDIISLSPISATNQDIINRLGVRYTEANGYTAFYQ